MLKDILISCFGLIDEVEMRDKLEGISQKSTITTELGAVDNMTKNNIKLMTNCTLNVLNSITRGFVPNWTIENIKSDESGKIYFKDFEQTVISIKSVTDELNNHVVYQVFFDHIKVPFKNKELSVCYNFESRPLASLFDSYFLPLGLTERIIALGAVAEYLQIKLLYSEASLFESKFKAELENIKQKAGNRYFPAWRN